MSTTDEHILLTVLKAAPIAMRAIFLQSYIAEYGPIPNQLGAEVRALISGITFARQAEAPAKGAK